MYVSNGERRHLTDRGLEGRPDLIVEVLSPSSARIDKVKKPARYADFGVAEYWFVDADRRTVVVWAFDHGATELRLETDRVIWQPEPALPALELNVPPLFEAP